MDSEERKKDREFMEGLLSRRKEARGVNSAVRLARNMIEVGPPTSEREEVWDQVCREFIKRHETC